ncbi:hypothetical protein [Peptoanaerobacter stomatis]|uniref:hypothetical protein n=1 Tax=Peptoanaerobacter stomatis TaxID=796937 RepID=UPI003F9FA870
MSKLTTEEINQLSLIYLHNNYINLDIKTPKDCFEQYKGIKEQFENLNYPNGKKLKVMDKKLLGL